MYANGSCNKNADYNAADANKYQCYCNNTLGPKTLHLASPVRAFDSRPPQKRLPLPPTSTHKLPSLERMRKLIRPKRQHARDEPHRIILKRQNPRRRHQHDRPPLRPLLVRDVPMPLGGNQTLTTTNTAIPYLPAGRGRRDTILPEIRRAVVQTLAHLGEFQTRSNDHNAQQRPRERPQQVEQRRPQKQPQQQLERAQEDDTRPAARAKAVLRR